MNANATLICESVVCGHLNRLHRWHWPSADRNQIVTTRDDMRFNRLVEQEAMDGAAAYKPAEFLDGVRNGIWRELEAPSVRIDAYRRNLQRAYLELLSEKLNGRAPVTDGQRPFLRRAAFAESDDRGAMLHATDRATRLHLEDSKDQLAKALDPEFAAPAPTAAPQLQQGGRRGFDDLQDGYDPSDLAGQVSW